MTFARAADRLAWPVDAARPEPGTTDGEVTELVAMVNAVACPRIGRRLKIARKKRPQPDCNFLVSTMSLP
jgi:hypothetical protein